MATVVYGGQDRWSSFGKGLSQGFSEARKPENQLHQSRERAIKELMQQGLTRGQAEGEYLKQVDPKYSAELSHFEEYAGPTADADMASKVAQARYNAAQADYQEQYGGKLAESTIGTNQAQAGWLGAQTENYPESLRIKDEHNEIMRNMYNMQNTRGVQGIETDRQTDIEKIGVDISQILLNSDKLMETPLAKAYTPSQQSRVYRDNAARKLGQLQALEGQLDDNQKAAFTNSILGDVTTSLETYSKNNDADGQLEAFQAAIRMFKPFKGTEKDWVWQSFLTMARGFQPVVQKSGMKFWQDDKTFDPIKEATQ